MKYEKRNVVSAIYDNGEENPFLAAMPDILPATDFYKQIESNINLPVDLAYMTSENRRKELSRLSSLFVPMPYMYAIYDTLYRAIATTYTTRTTIESIRQINALWSNSSIASYAMQADSGSILGVPGIGKTSSIRKCLSVMPQVIEHITFKEQPFFCKQVLYIHIECPSDCSVKTLGYNIITALDRAIGSCYMDSLSSIRSASASAIATQIKILCMTHHIGLIIVDEIQNAVVTAQKNNQIRPLIKFLVELTNDTCTALYFVGTSIAEELFVSHEHLKRRTRGIRLLPLRPDGMYHDFISKIWRYQYTQKQADLTDKLINELYDYSGGIPAYIIKIFMESQVQAILLGCSSIDDKIIRRTVELLSIKIPKVFSSGTYISDFELASDFAQESNKNELQPRLYSKKRGRKAEKRDDKDLLIAFKHGVDMIKFLAEFEMLEKW